MTLVLTCLTNDFLLQVSDRRLVDGRPGGTYRRVLEDDQTKAIIVNDVATFAYTGWAVIAGERSHEWFAREMQPYSDKDRLGDGLFAIRRALTDWFSRQPIGLNVPKFHAYVGAGWFRKKGVRGVLAGIELVTNFRDSQGRILATPAQEFARLRHLMHPRQKLKLFAEGVGPPEKGRMLVLERYLRHKVFLRDPRRTALVLAHELRRVAEVYGKNGPVGKGLTVVCLPKQYALQGGRPNMGEPEPNTLSVYYVPHRGRRQISRMPVFLRRGFPLMISDLTFDVPPPADGSDPYADWRKELILDSSVFRGRRLP